MHLNDYDPEIFDDNDFYHQVCTTEQKVLVFFISLYKKFHLTVNLTPCFLQLLREFIERKSNVDPNDPIAMGR